MSALKLFLPCLLILSSVHAFAKDGDDPRNVPGYDVLFDLDSEGKTDLVNGYGAYLQYYTAGSKPYFRYCDNFEGSGLSGRPNLKRERKKLVPFGKADDTAYICHDLTLEEVKAGRKLIYIGDKSFFAIRTETWDQVWGGDILFQIAKKIPLIGSPTYRVIRARAVNQGMAGWSVHTVIPRGELIYTDWMHFGVSASGFGIPNGIKTLTLNPGTRLERAVDIDTLEPGKTI